MSLAPHERQALARIEKTLVRSDPALDVMLMTFTPPRRSMLRWLATRWRWRRPHLVTTMALVMTAVSVFVLGVLLLGSGRRPTCANAAQTRPGSRATPACTLPPGGKSPAFPSSGK